MKSFVSKVIVKKDDLNKDVQKIVVDTKLDNYKTIRFKSDKIERANEIASRIVLPS